MFTGVSKHPSGQFHIISTIANEQKSLFNPAGFKEET